MVGVVKVATDWVSVVKSTYNTTYLLFSIESTRPVGQSRIKLLEVVGRSNDQ